MKFYLGTDRPGWLWQVSDVPLFVSHRRLRPYKAFRPATTSWALDSGGFTELSHPPHRWTTSPAEYATAVRRYATEIGRLEWASPQDSMCEPWILEQTGGTVPEHQAATITNYLTLRDLDPDLPFVPVLQGWELDDYLRHIDAYAAAGIDLTAEPRVGVGSVCRRQATGQIAMILGTIAGCGLRLHGFGLKTAGLAAAAHSLVSADSMAWSFGGRMTHRRGCACNRCLKNPRDQLKHCGGPHRAEAHCLTYALRWRAGVLDAIDAPKQLALGEAI